MTKKMSLMHMVGIIPNWCDFSLLAS